MNALSIVLLCLINQLIAHRGNELTITLVTALWKPTNQINEGTIPYAHMLDMLTLLMKTQENIIIFGDQYTMEQVRTLRNSSNTVFVLKTITQLQELSTSKLVSSYIETLKKSNPAQYNKYSNEPQFRSYQHSAYMYSKPLLLKQALSYDIFNTDYMYWINPDIHALPEYSNRYFFNRQHNILRKFSHHLQLPFIVRTGNISNLNNGYKNRGENYGLINTYAMTEWFGGRVQTISSIAHIYQNILAETLINGDYWSQESIFTLMVHRYPRIITEINNLLPGGLFTFEINNFRERPIQQLRHVSIIQSGNSTIRFKERSILPIPVFTTEVFTYESYYEYELLLSMMKFRMYRTETFLSIIVFAYVVVQISKLIFKKGESVHMARIMEMESI